MDVVTQHNVLSVRCAGLANAVVAKLTVVEGCTETSVVAFPVRAVSATFLAQNNVCVVVLWRRKKGGPRGRCCPPSSAVGTIIPKLANLKFGTKPSIIALAVRAERAVFSA